MNFSIKIKKFCDGMIVYDHLLEDEGAIHIPFAQSFYVTITTIVGQLKQFLIDLKNHVCHEIPDINIEQMDVDKIMSPKFKRDMESFGNITMRNCWRNCLARFWTRHRWSSSMPSGTMWLRWCSMWWRYARCWIIRSRNSSANTFADA